MIIANNHFSYFFKKYYKIAVSFLLLTIYSFVLAFLSEWISRNSFMLTKDFFLRYPLIYSNLAILFFLWIMTLYILTKRAYLAVLISGILVTVASAVNYFKLYYRKEPFYPWDLTSVSEATEISASIKFKITTPLWVAILGILALFVFLLAARLFTKTIKINFLFWLILLVISVFTTLKFSEFSLYNQDYLNSIRIKENKFQQSQSYKRNGFIPSFLYNIKYLKPSKPQSYNEETINKIVSGIKKKKTTTLKPNIIFIMNESWCDSDLFKNVKFKEEVLQTTNRLRKEYMSGYLFSPGFGGGTCNSEFEVLTGNSMLNLPTGSTPYIQYIRKDPFPSYPDFLKKIGYNTYAIHSYGKKFWNRNLVYPKMQFDEFISSADFVNPNRYREWINDDDTMDKIVETYEKNKSTGKPFFNYTVTMQNHMPYTADNYKPEHRVKLDAPTMSAADRDNFISYVTGIRDADRALGKLIKYFEKVKEPTIIVMFGDHLGNFGEVQNTYVAGGYTGEIEASAKNKTMLYTTPFVCWNNFDKKQIKVEQISLYQLTPLITDTFKLQKPLYFDYLLDQIKTFRGTSQGIYLDKNGVPTYDTPKQAEEYIKNHNLLQYDIIFGKGYGVEKLFGAGQ